MQKPFLFLDFDRTLFDTEQFYEWLGENVEERITDLTTGKIAPPNFPPMLYADTLSFLQNAKKNFHIVLLTYTAHITRQLQEKKVFGSGIAAYVDDVLIVSGERGSGGKAKEVERFIAQTDNASGRNVFVDDRLENISEVKTALPSIYCVRIERISKKNEQQLPGLAAADAVVANLSQLAALLQA